MKPKRRRWWWALAIAGVLVPALWWATSSPPPSETLPDGTRLTLQKVTVSRHPKHCFGNPLQKMLSSLPGKWGAKLAGNTLCDLGDQGKPVLTIWLSCNTTNLTNLPRVVFRDEKGRQWRNICWSPLKNGRGFALTAEEWPRNSKTFTLDLYEKWVHPLEKRNAGLVVPNPGYRKSPVWVAEPLPATRKVGEMEFTLESVKVEEIPNPSNVDFYFHHASIATAVKERGAPAEGWRVGSLSMADALGNDTGSLGSYWRQPDQWYWPSMPGIDAVKLRIEFTKTNGFASNEIFVLRGVPVLNVAPWRFHTNLPVGRLVLWPGPSRVTVAPPTFGGSDTNRSSRRFVLLSVATDTVREAAIVVNGSMALYGSGPKTLDITVAAPPVHWVEWMVPAKGTVTNASPR